MDKETVNSLVAEAQHIAENAGNLIMTFFDELAEEEVEYKADQSPVTLADKAANKQIVEELGWTKVDIRIGKLYAGFKDKFE